MVLERDLEAVAAERGDLPNADDVYDPDEKIPLADVIDEAFVRERTEFETVDELVAAGPGDAGSADELETVPYGEWDEFVAESTDFATEDEFVMAARDHWVAKRLELA